MKATLDWFIDEMGGSSYPKNPNSAFIRYDDGLCTFNCDSTGRCVFRIDFDRYEITIVNPLVSEIEAVFKLCDFKPWSA